MKPKHTAETRIDYWRRVLRPLFWWVLLVLVLYGIRLHQRLSAVTYLKFSSAVEGQTSIWDSGAQLDGKEFISGQNVRIGWHQLTLTQPNGYPITTNLFIWYGERNLGKITLERTKGTLSIQTTPIPERLIIRGPEFTTTLTNKNGFSARVPTDIYKVETFYKYWKSLEVVRVSTDTMANLSVAPRLGTIAITASHPDIYFDLNNGNGELLESGQLPITINGLPEDSKYRLKQSRGEDRQETSFFVVAGRTNDLKVEFVYGVVTIESTPAGAAVLKGDKQLGLTPLTLPEVQPGTFAFSLRLDEYEPALANLVVTANQTNTFSTNLVSKDYTRAMNAAHQYYDGSDYDRAIEAATEALKHKSGDADATNLLAQATIQVHLARATSLANQGLFTNAIAEANLALGLAPENTQAKDLLADFTNREQLRLEAIRKREAELAEQARLRHERELAEQRARERAKEFVQEFSNADAKHEDANLFLTRELTESNFPADKAADNIVAAMRDSPITFDNAQINWITSYMFSIEPRQRMTPGYRSILIMGCQTRDNEVLIRFKVYEYEHEPVATVSLLGGLLQAKAQASVTSQDPQVIAANAQKFRLRIKAGVDLVQGLIIKAVSQP